VSAAPRRIEARHGREAVLLATIGSLIRRRDRVSRELTAVDESIKQELRALAAIRGVTFLRIEHVKQELKI